MVISIDANVLTAYYQAKAGIPGASSSSDTSGGATTAPTNPTPPWSPASNALQASALTSSVLAGGRFIDPSAAKLDVPNASADYKKLFSLYQGLNALEGIATQYTAAGTSTSTQATIAARFTAGMQEVGSYIDQTKFNDFQLAQGVTSTSDTTTVGVKKETDTYTTGTIYSGDPSAEVPAFQGPTAFDLTYTRYSGTKVTVNFDLSEMGSTPRTMANVVQYLNSKLKASGAYSNFTVVRTPGTPRTSTVAGKTVTLGTNPDTYALKLNGVSTETPSFSAADATSAVYVGDAQGTVTTTPGKTTFANGVSTTAPATTTSDVTQQLLKFQTDPATNATSATDGKIYGNALSAAVQNARASATGPDGSVYLLTDVNAAIGGQPIAAFTSVSR